MLLSKQAAALRAAGLRRVTVSLDALDPTTFHRMADTPIPVERVLEGIDAALDAGLGVKLNTVVQRGVNEHAVGDLARYARERGVTARFIEYMDVGESNGWRTDDVVPAAEIVRLVGEVAEVEPLDAGGAVTGEGVAERYRYRDGGEVGVIASVTRPFCGTCVRARLSAVGELYTCLFATKGHDLRALLRGGADDRELTEHLATLWSVRDDRYSELRTAGTAPEGPKVEMSYIGG